MAEKQEFIIYLNIKFKGNQVIITNPEDAFIDTPVWFTDKMKSTLNKIEQNHVELMVKHKRLIDA